MSEERRLSSYVDPGLSAGELARQWQAIERRIDPDRAKRFPRFVLPVALAAALVLVAVGVTFLGRPPPPSAWNGAVLDSGADEVSVALGDGSKIELEPASRVVVREGSPHAVELDLRKGSARFDVTHVPGRSFRVRTDGVQVRVVGTRFSVAVMPLPAGGGERVVVSVDQGVVEADTLGGRETTRIRAGETWSTTVGAKAVVAADEPVRAPSANAAPEPPPLLPAPPVSAPARLVAEPTAQELFEKANAARQAGDARGAATAYQALLRHHPSDARAGLSAFELGRLKMDQLGDVSGAVAALQRAVALAPGSAFREDALARLVRAYATMGDGTRCERARKAYLDGYPRGVHAAAVQKGCGGGR